VAEKARDLYGKWNPRARDAVLFGVGIVGIVNELWYQPEARGHVLVFLLSLIGIPVVETLDKLRRDRNT
jgi:hypothetical protein